MAGLLAAGLAWRACPSGDESPGAAATADAPRRGGQLVASVRAAPRTFNRLVAADQTTDLLYTLLQGHLVRINHATFELEPWLAERWDSSPDGRTHTLHLRQGLQWSDGAPFTSDDVLFSVRAVFDPKVESVAATSLMVGGRPMEAAAPDDHTVVVTYAEPSGPGVRLLDMLPILPRHVLEPALAAGELADAWDSTTPPAEIVGMGPFVMREYRAGERIVLERNPHYWRVAPDGDRLPYLDRLVLEVVPDQNAELLRLQSGEIDMTNSELRADDYLPVRRAEREGTLAMVEQGVSPDADAFWFCMKPEAKRADPRFAFVSRPEFRQALSHAVDREAFAETVFFGEAVPIWGPVTSGNRMWFSPNVPRYPHDLDRARALLAGIGLEDRDGDGIVEDKAGIAARFTVITQRGISHYERGTTVLREQVALAGVALDVVPLDFGAMLERMFACDYDAIYMRPLSAQDPASNLDYWLSSGEAHLWNMQQKQPATDWEAQIDALMLEQARTLDPLERRKLFNEVQTVFAQHLPVLYFASPRLYYAYNTRVHGVVPSVMRPPALWSPDTLSVTDAR